MKKKLVKLQDCLDETKKIRKMDSKSRSTIKKIAIESQNLLSASDLRPPPINLPKRSQTPGNSEYRRIKLNNSILGTKKNSIKNNLKFEIENFKI